jgi:hypothetical protein
MEGFVNEWLKITTTSSRKVLVRFLTEDLSEVKSTIIIPEDGLMKYCQRYADESDTIGPIYNIPVPCSPHVAEQIRDILVAGNTNKCDGVVNRDINDYLMFIKVWNYLKIKHND